MAPDMNQVSRRPLIDFDHHSADHAADWARHLASFGQRCPVGWSDQHDGFWLLSSHAAVWEAARDHHRFSTEHDMTGDGHGYGGIAIPPSPLRASPLELDPPAFTSIRQLMNPVFSPARSRAWRPWLDDVVHQQLDLIIESGQMDLIYDLGAVVPGRFTMRFLGLPEHEWESWALPFHEYMSPPGSECYAKATHDLLMVAGRLFELVLDRRAHPRDDYVSFLAEAVVDGEPLSEEAIAEIAFLVLAGGVDTTTSLFGCAAEWLSRQPEARTALREDPKLWATAIEEFLRFFSPTQGTARTVRKDTSFLGCPMAEGDRVLLSWAGANHDPAEFGDPETLRLDRSPNRHTAFGIGIHRCLGSNVARVELQAMLEGLLSRVPDFEVDQRGATKYGSVGITNGYLTLPAKFAPGPRTGRVPGEPPATHVRSGQAGDASDAHANGSSNTNAE